MSRGQILLSGFGFIVLGALGCSSNVADPEQPMQQIEIGSVTGPTSLNELREMEHCYFPLHKGDRWVYLRTENDRPVPESETVVVEVTGSHRSGDGESVYHLDNFMFPVSRRPTQFCNQSPGMACEVTDDGVSLWYPWWRFSLPVETPIVIPALYADCIHGSTGTYLGSPSTVWVPAGVFEESVTIHYSSTPCEDAGLVREVFAPGVGLIERTTTSFVGEVTWKLVYANVGGREWGTDRALVRR